MARNGAADPPSRGAQVASAALGVVLVGLVIALLFLLAGDDEALAPTGPTGPTTPASAPSSSNATTGTTSAAPTVAPETTQAALGDLVTALWPPATQVDYSEPVALVHDFTVRFVGMADPVLSPYMAGDSRSGEIEVRAAAGATPVTAVFVRQLGPDDAWYVLGAAAADIDVELPRPLTAIESPVDLSGTALAFEGTVAVALWEDGALEPLATTVVTGSGAPPAGRFSGQLVFTEPTAAGGALLFTSASGEDGAVVEFAALRVLFG